MKSNVSLLLLGLCVLSNAQVLKRYNPSVYKNDHELKLAFTGGMNSPQFSNFDFNKDGKQDLVFFDRMSGALTTLVAEETETNFSYRYAPQFERFFPKLVNWMLMADYDGDGLQDLFTNTTLGIKVYRSSWNNQQLTFSLVKDPLISRGFSSNVNIQVNPTDIPALVDWDNDGDIDIFHFNFLSGSQVEYHQNQSKERFGHGDSLVFTRKDDCFGGFEEVSCNVYEFGLSCPTFLRQEFPSTSRVEHVGPGGLLIEDFNEDGAKDILVGKEDCDKIVYLQNQSKAVNGALYEKIEANFPATNPFQFAYHPFAYLVDVNGKKELIYTTNLGNNGSRQSNMRQSVFLKSKTSNEFIPFLQDEMIDVGENAAPCFFDVDDDGDLDLLIGSKGQIENSLAKAGLYWFEKRGDSFYFKTDNLFNIQSSRYLNLIPQFVDFNKDGKEDFLLTFTDLERFGQTYTLYWPNNGTAFSARTLPPVNELTELDLQLNQEDVPHFLDLNGDGDMDAIVAKNGGAFVTYLNSNGKFSLQTNFYGGFQNNVSKRRPSVFSLKLNDNEDLDLLVAYDQGELEVVYDFLKKDPRNFNSTVLYESLNDHNLTLRISNRPIIYAKDGYIAIGNIAGGIKMWQYDHKLPLDQSFLPKIYPNPGNETLHIESDRAYHLEIHNSMGSIVEQVSVIENYPKAALPTLQLTNGLYIIVATSVTGQVYKMKWVKR